MKQFRCRCWRWKLVLAAANWFNHCVTVCRRAVSGSTVAAAHGAGKSEWGCVRWRVCPSQTTGCVFHEKVEKTVSCGRATKTCWRSSCSSPVVLSPSKSALILQIFTELVSFTLHLKQSIHSWSLIYWLFSVEHSIFSPQYIIKNTVTHTPDIYVILT